MIILVVNLLLLVALLIYIGWTASRQNKLTTSLLTSLEERIDQHQRQNEAAQARLMDKAESTSTRLDLEIKTLQAFHDYIRQTDATTQKNMEKWISDQTAIVRTFTLKADGVSEKTDLMYKDFGLLLELLKAGLMNDLIKDLNREIQHQPIR
jgi:hypothetical protein